VPAAIRKPGLTGRDHGVAGTITGIPRHPLSVRPANYRIGSMLSRHTENGYRNALPGIRQKTLVYGKNMLMAEFRLDKGSRLPVHTHPHEQTGYLVSGHMTLRIGDEDADIRPGDSWNIPGNAEHSATIHEDSVAIEIFSPVRTEYLPE
jgi:quercetin dioxygenase-like cupin family protein